MAGPASEHRGPSIQENQSQKPTMSQTYANAAFVPKRDQAIVIDSLEGCTIDDYLDGLEQLLELSNVKFISKISGGRVCIYLANKSTVEALSNKQVQVKNHTLAIRPLLEKNKRVVISNASPSIPNEVLIQALKNIGIVPVSQMHYIRASSSKPGRSHIYSFRRQVYIKEEDEELLPENLQIAHEDSTQWIYLSTESTHCFACKQKGHIAKVCPEFQTHSNIPNDSQELQDNTSTDTSIQPNSILKTTENSSNDRPNLKRPPASTSSESTLSSNPSELPGKKLIHYKPKDETFLKPTTKKSKITTGKQQTQEELENQKDYLDEVLIPVKKIIEDNPNKYILNYNDIKAFIEKTYGQRNIKEISEEFTKETPKLYDMLEAIHPIIPNRKLKARIIRMKNRLLTQFSSDWESDSSQQSAE